MNTSEEVRNMEKVKKKDKYESPTIEVICYECEDIITTSGGTQLPYRSVTSSFNLY